jgi:hypothetical protein
MAHAAVSTLTADAGRHRLHCASGFLHVQRTVITKTPYPTLHRSDPRSMRLSDYVVLGNLVDGCPHA